MAPPRELSRLFKESTVYAIGNAINRLGGFILLPLYTSYLTVGEYGTLELLYTVGAVATGILSLGLSSATLRFYFDYEDQADRNAVISTNLFASLLIGVLGALVIAVAGQWLIGSALPAATPMLALYLLLAAVVLELSTEVCLAFVRARGQVLLFVGASILKLLTQCAANYYLVRIAQEGIVGVLKGNLASIALEWVILLAYCLWHCGMRFDMHKLKATAKYCAPFLLTTLTGIVQGNADRVLIGSLLSIEALGLYGLAQKLARALNDFIGIPFGLAYGAFRFSIMKRPDAAELQATVVRYLLCAIGIMALTLSYFTPEILRVMATPQYWKAADLMPILAFGVCLTVIVGPLQTGILYAKKTGDLFYISVALAVCGVLVGWALTKLFGLIGACAAVVITAVVAVVLTAKRSHRYFKVNYRIGVLATFAALLFAFMGIPSFLGGMSPVAQFFAKLGLIAVFCVLLIATKIVSLQEVRAIIGVIRNR
jgi:O-antigen/teichoic acid export membrane protein